MKSWLVKAWHFSQRLRNPRQKLDLFIDHWTFRRTYGTFLGRGGEFSDSAKKALIVSLSEGIAQMKREGMFAKALQLHGYTPVILTFKSCKSAIKYFKIYGIDRFVFLEDFYDDSVPEVETNAVFKSFENRKSINALLGIEYRGVDVGRHVLSSVMRQLREQEFSLSDPYVQRLLRRRTEQSVRTIFAAEAILHQLQPKMTLFLEKGYTPYGEIFDVSVNGDINTIQWVGAQRADGFVFKRYTKNTRYVHPFSLSDETWERVRDMPWTPELEQELTHELVSGYTQGKWFNRRYLKTNTIKSAGEVTRQLGLHPDKKTAVVFSHVLWDATFFYGTNLFGDYEEWLVETVKAACQNERVNWVIKLHPDYVWKLKKERGGTKVRDEYAIEVKVGRLPSHVKLLHPDTDISTFSLFDITDYCITVRGTIGIEMSCFGIPVITAGTGRYSGFGFTIDSNNREEYLYKILHIQDIPKLSYVQTELAKKHAYALFLLRPLSFSSFEEVRRPLEKLGHPLDKNIVIRARSFEELVQALDLRAFVEWAVHSDRLDFLAPLKDPIDKMTGIDFHDTRFTSIPAGS